MRFCILLLLFVAASNSRDSVLEIFLGIFDKFVIFLDIISGLKSVRDLVAHKIVYVFTFASRLNEIAAKNRDMKSFLNILLYCTYTAQVVTVNWCGRLFD